VLERMDDIFYTTLVHFMQGWADYNVDREEGPDIQRCPRWRCVGADNSEVQTER
jgi:hypothetical protein